MEKSRRDSNQRRDVRAPPKSVSHRERDTSARSNIALALCLLSKIPCAALSSGVNRHEFVWRPWEGSLDLHSPHIERLKSWAIGAVRALGP